jgi:hypothetical protein
VAVLARAARRRPRTLTQPTAPAALPQPTGPANRSANRPAALPQPTGSTDTIKDNTLNAPSAYGLYLYQSDSDVTGNTLDAYYGIYDERDTDGVISGNTTGNNDEAGVYVYTDGSTSGFAATLSKNTATGNRYGLYSQFRVAGRGNVATGNTQLNCHDVACRA